MAGGEGSRLRPLTCDIPKPMVPIINVPIMEHIIRLLKSHGITDIAVTLMYLPQKIKDYFGNGSNFGVNIQYFVEDSPLGTAGSVKNAESFLDETFVVISGDCLTSMNLSKAMEFHKNSKSIATIMLAKVDVPLEYGVVITENDMRVKGFLEKPSWGEVFSDTVNTGTYILEPEVLAFIKSGKKFDFSNNLFPLLLSQKQRVFGHIISEYWCDIGDIQAYIKAHSDILQDRLVFDGQLTEYKPGIWVGNGTIISPKAKLHAPCVIGSHCRIGSGVSIDSMTVIGNNNVIEDKASIKRSVIWNNNYIENGAEIRGAIICNKVSIKNNASVFENSIIGEGCIINERAMIKPNVKIWPNKSIESMAVVDRNIIWASKHAKTIFGENGISGIINVDINPEFATRLGAAYGSMLKKSSKVVVSSTTSNSARMFKHAFISGLLSVGIEVFNLSSMLTPIARHAIQFLAVEGGIHIKICSDNQNKIKVEFMDSKGVGISRVMERKIENAFFREDYKRCSGEEINRLNNLTDFRNYYVRSIVNEVDFSTIKDSGRNVFIISSSDFVLSIIVPMLTDLGCKVISRSTNLPVGSAELAENIKNADVQFAAYIDSNAEVITLFDGNGNIISEELFQVLTAIIVFKSVENAHVAVPITAPSIMETVASWYGGATIRTKASVQAVMDQLLNTNLSKKKDQRLQYLLNFDALASVVKIIEFLSIQKVNFSDLLDEIPTFFMSKRKIFCPWELKGRIMRALITEESIEKLELLDGVKISHKQGWVLIMPDADLPLLRVYSEGESLAVAEENAIKYINKIKFYINQR